MVRELECILANPFLHVVLVDDARLLGLPDGYPPPVRLAELAKTHGRQFFIEHDVARLLPPSSVV